jgi:hypothetical protein
MTSDLPTAGNRWPSRSPAAHSDIQHSAPARVWLRHFCPSIRSTLNAAYLGKGLDRFTLRGREKVHGQWKLFGLVHNIEKLAHYGVT